MDEEQVLGPAELTRYARHIVLREIGGPGQARLKSARVLVAGAGGLGSPLIAYLAAAGVGTLGIADDDTVSLSNLQRQIIHDTNNVGMAKTQSAAITVTRLNPHIRTIEHRLRLTGDNIDEILQDYDIIADGSDSFETRMMLADAAERRRIPMVMAAVGRFDGSLSVLMPYARDADGRAFPRLKDLFPEAPPPGTVPDCEQAGIVGALTGVIGTLQAMEIIKYITGAGELLTGRLLLYDGLAARFDTIRYRRNQD